MMFRPFAPLLITVLTLFACATGLNAQEPAAESPVSVIRIDTDRVQLTRFRMGYYVDHSQAMDLDQVQRQRFKPINNEVTLGTDAKVTWSRLDVHNAGSQATELFVHHPHAYHLRSISFYEVSNGQLLNKAEIHLDSDAPKSMMFGGSAVFPFKLVAGESKTIFVKNVTFSHQWYSIQLFDEEHSKRALVGSGNYISLLVGMMLALMIYNFFLYLSARKVENIIYALYLISGTIWVAISYGVAANFFGIYSASILQLNSNLLSMPSFLVLFVMFIFETRRRYPKEHLALSLMLALLVGDFIYSLFDVVGALRPASSLAALMMLVTLGVSISLWRKRDPLAKYFLLGHSMFIIFNMMAVFYYKGLSQANQINSHGVGIGILLEALMMAFILSYRIKTLEKIKAKQAELKRLADTDPMTNLYNRRYFDVVSPAMLAAALESGTELVLMIADIDHFKAINDSHGHQVGDQVIVEFANILRQNQRPDDISCRFGGEEFVMLLRCNLANAQLIAERIRSVAEQARISTPAGEQIGFTVSIGVHPVRLSAETLQNELELADKALYAAKSRGRNQVVVSLAIE